MELKTASSGLAQDHLAETGLGMPVGAPVAYPTLTAWVQVEPWHHPPLFLLRLQALFNPLCKVLCILQSLYLCSIGPMSVGFLVRDTPHTSNCSPKPLYSWIPAATSGWPQHTSTYGTVSLWSGPFQVTLWCMAKPRHHRQVHSPQLLLKPTRADRRSLRGETSVANSFAITEAIAVAFTSSTE